MVIEKQRSRQNNYHFGYIIEPRGLDDSAEPDWLAKMHVPQTFLKLAEVGCETLDTLHAISL